MNRTDLTLLIVAAIVIALVLGWSARWLFDRLNHQPHEPESPDEQAVRLENAEAARQEAEAELERIRTEFASEYNQLKAELDATMDGLGTARQKAESLQAELDALNTPEDDEND